MSRNRQINYRNRPQRINPDAINRNVLPLDVFKLTQNRSTPDEESFLGLQHKWYFQKEDWHEVGAAGEPAFRSFVSNTGGDYAPVRFRKTPDYQVEISGKFNASATVLGALFTLPVGYRPIYIYEGVLFRILATSILFEPIEIRLNGDVYMTQTLNGDYFIDIKFPLD